MMEQINTFLSKKPDRKTLIIAVVTIVSTCLCCLCLALYLWKGQPTQNTPTPTPSETPTPTETPTETETPTPTPSITGSFTPTYTLTPSLTVTLTLTETLTYTPTITQTPSITPTPNPLSKPEHLAVFMRTGNVWVTSRDNNRLVELDGNDLHVLSIIDIDSPNGIAIWQDQGLAYVTNRDTSNVSEIDLVAHKITRVIGVGKDPFGVTVVQSTGTVFVGNFSSNDVSCIVAGADKSVLATPLRELVLKGPTGLFGFSYNTDIPNTAMLVDSNGTVAVVGFNPNNFSRISTSPCSVSPVTSINNDGLADISQSTSNPYSFFVSDHSGKKVVLIPDISNVSTTDFPKLDLPSEPSAFLDLGRCLAVVVPKQNRLDILDIQLSKVARQIKIGKQGDNGGQGLAYNSNLDVAYVTNRDDNSVSRIPSPCK